MDFALGLATYISGVVAQNYLSSRERRGQGSAYQLEGGLYLCASTRKTSSETPELNDGDLEVGEFELGSSCQALPKVCLQASPAKKGLRFCSFGFEFPLVGKVAVASGFMAVAITALLSASTPAVSSPALPTNEEQSVQCCAQKLESAPQLLAAATAPPQYHQFKLGRVSGRYNSHVNTIRIHTNYQAWTSYPQNLPKGGPTAGHLKS